MPAHLAVPALPTASRSAPWEASTPEDLGRVALEHPGRERDAGVAFPDGDQRLVEPGAGIGRGGRSPTG